MNRILIADSGATKTDWLYIDGADTIQVRTQGLYPSTISEQTDYNELELSLGALEPDRILFYGTGCGYPAADEKVRRLLQKLFPKSEIEIDSDLSGTGKAFFGTSRGAVIILGTGAICALVENGAVVRKSASLGYAIGDEGSAADLGRRLLRIYFRNEGSPEVLKYIGETLDGADYRTMMNRIYTAQKPNRELAAVAGLVLKKPYPPDLNEMVRQSFQDFITHQLKMLNLEKSDSIVATGKVAEAHQIMLLNLLKEHGYSRVEVRFPVIATFREKILSSEINL